MKILIAQGGGPTAVINQSLVGAVMAAKEAGHEIIGSRHGIKGIIDEDFVELHSLDNEKLMKVAETPSSALGSTRDKPDEEYCTKILNIFQKHEITGFLYIGGNDSSETIRLVLEAAKKANYAMKGFHIPKTVDNDLMENDHTPGFPSAARFVAKAIMGLDRDNEALPGVHICIIMGRHAGFLTCAGGLGGAHRVYIPEIPFNLDHFAKEVKETVEQHGRAVLAISEGIQDADGNPIISHFVDQETDAHGNLQLSGLPLGNVLADFLKEKGVAKRVRQDTFGYPQRCYPDASKVDQTEAFECGKVAVKSLQSDLSSGSITIKRTSNSPYTVEIAPVDLDKVANLTRHLPEEYYDKESKNITEAGRDYLMPLIGEIPQMERL
ncbi:MAG: diphosphate--fructose-6-phosphate 1-phosphotransferase [Candidatus Gracilibacteria bacterium]|nr:diphosphate--fructose-6-phosphate 1-phosphotransferase [Candidatus Gracilibacteria bacterium]